MKRTLIIDYRVNGSLQDQHMTEYYFGQGFVRKLAATVKRNFRTSGVCQMTAFRPGIGYLTLTVR